MQKMPLDKTNTGVFALVAVETVDVFIMLWCKLAVFSEEQLEVMLNACNVRLIG